MTTLLLIRHALNDSVGRSLAGTSPGVHLNTVGERQAAELAERLRGLALDALVSSPMERALETAAPIGHATGTAITTDPAFIEFGFGTWTGRAFDELAADAGWQRFNSARSVTRPPGGELMLDVQRRAVTGMLGLAERHPAGTVAIVSHADVIRAVLMYCLGMPIDFVHRLEIAPARVSVVELGAAGALRVRLLNADTVPRPA